MIVSFSVSNFRSFLSEETLSLVASNRLSGEHASHLVPIPDTSEKALRAAVLYGANGAGKSNLFKALQYVEQLSLSAGARNGGTRRRRFLLAGAASDPSSFDLQFIQAGQLYRYGLKLDDDRILEEWLYRISDGRQKLLFERTADERGRGRVEAPGLTGGEKLKALSVVGAPSNQSFLATVNLTLSSEDLTGDLIQVLRWFNQTLTLIPPDASFTQLAQFLEHDAEFRAFAGGFLQSASTGVDDIRIFKKEIPRKQLEKWLSPDVAAKLLENMATRQAESAVIQEGKDLIVLGQEQGRVYHHGIQALHKQSSGDQITLDISEESDGTRRLLNLIPALYRLRSDEAVFVVDEIDRSLHPLLVKEFLQSFLRACGASPSQIIVTTHESNLLDQDLLRRDEIWFAEKDDAGATHLYSLLDFKVRNDLEIRKHYLQGRFGAVPFLGGIERLLPAEPCPPK